MVFAGSPTSIDMKNICEKKNIFSFNRIDAICFDVCLEKDKVFLGSTSCGIVCQQIDDKNHFNFTR